MRSGFGPVAQASIILGSFTWASGATAQVPSLAGTTVVTATRAQWTFVNVPRRVTFSRGGEVSPAFSVEGEAVLAGGVLAGDPSSFPDAARDGVPPSLSVF